MVSLPEAGGALHAPSPYTGGPREDLSQRGHPAEARLRQTIDVKDFPDSLRMFCLCVLVSSLLIKAG
ncbi:MAG TPA: hypothetical protein VGN95_09055 [Pyrinomonadaceae bacterium]|nr:hypothetical protein [Pyrinomonadaceae bacterium]